MTLSTELRNEETVSGVVAYVPLIKHTDTVTQEYNRLLGWSIDDITMLCQLVKMR
jgi:hypothetical protein